MNDAETLSTKQVVSKHDHRRTFLGVFMGLCLLTVISVLLAYFPIFPNRVSNGIAIGIVACMKATLVICYFMHLRWEKVWKYFLTIPVIVLGIALGLSLIPDIGMREQYYSSFRKQRGPDVSNPKVESAEPSR